MTGETIGINDDFGVASLVASTYDNKWFTIAMGLFVLLLAVYAVLQSPLFDLRAIELVGADRVSPDDILRTGELEIGANLFSINLRELSQSLERIPLIEQVRLRRQFPGTLVVTVAERRPIAYLSTEGGIWAVDANGYPLFKVDRMSLAIPLVTAAPPVAPVIGESIDHEPLRGALRFVEALSVKTRSNLSEVHAEPGGITAYSRDRVTIALGGGGDAAEQARVLEALLDKIDAEGLSVSRIDVSRPRAPVLQQ